MRKLEAQGRLDREHRDAAQRRRAGRAPQGGRGLTRPEAAVLLAYAKMTLYEDLLRDRAARPGLFRRGDRQVFPAAAAPALSRPRSSSIGCAARSSPPGSPTAWSIAASTCSSPSSRTRPAATLEDVAAGLRRRPRRLRPAAALGRDRGAAGARVPAERADRAAGRRRARCWCAARAGSWPTAAGRCGIGDTVARFRPGHRRDPADRLDERGRREATRERLAAAADEHGAAGVDAGSGADAWRACRDLLAACDIVRVRRRGRGGDDERAARRRRGSISPSTSALGPAVAAARPCRRRRAARAGTGWR